VTPQIFTVGIRPLILNFRATFFFISTGLFCACVIFGENGQAIWFLSSATASAEFLRRNQEK
jgi:hypothetical protein